jgi:hypothetical protein
MRGYPLSRKTVTRGIHRFPVGCCPEVVSVASSVESTDGVTKTVATPCAVTYKEPFQRKCG